MRIIQLMFLAALLIVSRSAAVAAESANVRAMLVIASNEKGGSDSSLSAYAPTLRRILRFESFRLAGEGSANLATPGKAGVNLGRGHSLDLEADKSDGRGVRLRVRWEGGGRSLMNTGLVLQPGVPAVLGGPSTGRDGEVWAVILVAN
ncbi:MAG TPA: hypothetical protein VHO24_02810 [Opitutaceae bacterium]|nr:hypothetical protein [Opitutaceae bacterium]